MENEKKLKKDTVKDSKKTNVFLADIIFIFHCLIVLFVLFAPFTKIPAILILHIVFVISLIIHWKLNSNVCSLSVMESQLRGLDRTETFTHSFIAPIYDISSSEWANICYYITYFVLGLSIYFLNVSPKFIYVRECLNNTITWEDTFKCIEPLFTLN